MPEIYIIAPSKTMYDKAVQLVGNNNIEIGVLQGAFEIIDECIYLAKNGVKVFITRGGLKRILNQLELDAAIVEIPMLLSDYVPVLKKAVGAKGKVGVFNYENTPNELITICELLNIHAEFYIFDSTNSGEIFKKALKNNIVLSIGGATIEPYAKKINFPHYTIENNIESMTQAIESAKEILELRKREEDKRKKLIVKLKRFEAIFDYSHDGIIATNKDEEIELMNQNALKLLSLTKSKDQGRVLCDASPGFRVFSPQKQSKNEIDHIINIKKELINVNKIPLVSNEEYLGSVYTFYSIKELQSNEQKLRIKLHEKGLTAKYNFDMIAGISREILTAKKLAQSYTNSDFTILITGETGTGKELFAQSIHNGSFRKNGPFVAINCASLSESLLESELFGYSKGSFTGGLKKGKQGLFELAHGGTIFLDEIGEIPLTTQTQLLRVLEEKEIRRIGGDRLIPVDIRIIAATNKDLVQQIEKGLFREDLYYRLNVLNLQIPPLRDRKEDISILTELIMESLNITDDIMIKDFLDTLEDYPWPGNVRELRSLIKRLFTIQKYTNNEEVLDNIMKEMVLKDKSIQFSEIELIERNKIIKTLEENNMNVTETASQLGISRATLWRKRKKYNI